MSVLLAFSAIMLSSFSAAIRCSATMAMTDGRQALIDVRVSGDMIGEMSALNGEPRSATVTTCRTSKIRIIRRNELRAFLRVYPDAAMQLAGIVANRLRAANRRRVDFASHPVKIRLARFFGRSPRPMAIAIATASSSTST